MDRTYATNENDEDDNMYYSTPAGAQQDGPSDALHSQLSPRMMAVQTLKRAASLRDGSASPGGSHAGTLSRSSSVSRPLTLERSASDAARRLAMAKLTGEKIMVPTTPLLPGPLPTLADLQARQEQKLALHSPTVSIATSASRSNGHSNGLSEADLTRSSSKSSMHSHKRSDDVNDSRSGDIAPTRGSHEHDAEENESIASGMEERAQSRTDIRQAARTNLIRKLSRGRVAAASSAAKTLTNPVESSIGDDQPEARKSANDAAEQEPRPAADSDITRSTSVQRRPSLAELLSKNRATSNVRSPQAFAPTRPDQTSGFREPPQGSPAIAESTSTPVSAVSNRSILAPATASSQNSSGFSSFVSPPLTSAAMQINKALYAHIPMPPVPASPATPEWTKSPPHAGLQSHESVYSAISNFRPYRHTIERDRDSAIARLQTEDDFEFEDNSDNDDEAHGNSPRLDDQANLPMSPAQHVSGPAAVHCTSRETFPTIDELQTLDGDRMERRDVIPSWRPPELPLAESMAVRSGATAVVDTAPSPIATAMEQQMLSPTSSGSISPRIRLNNVSSLPETPTSSSPSSPFHFALTERRPLQKIKIDHGETGATDATYTRHRSRTENASTDSFPVSVADSRWSHMPAAAPPAVHDMTNPSAVVGSASPIPDPQSSSVPPLHINALRAKVGSRTKAQRLPEGIQIGTAMSDAFPSRAAAVSNKALPESPGSVETAAGPGSGYRFPTPTHPENPYNQNVHLVQTETYPEDAVLAETTMRAAIPPESATPLLKSSSPYSPVLVAAAQGSGLRSPELPFLPLMHVRSKTPLPLRMAPPTSGEDVAVSSGKASGGMHFADTASKPSNAHNLQYNGGALTNPSPNARFAPPLSYHDGSTASLESAQITHMPKDAVHPTRGAVSTVQQDEKNQVMDRLSTLLASVNQTDRSASPIQPPRSLLLHAPVLQVVNANTVKDRYLFLFSDILVIAKPLIEDDHNGDPLTPTLATKFLVKSIVELPKLKLVAQAAESADDVSSKKKHPLLLTFVDRFANDPKKSISALTAKAGLANDPATIANLLFRNPELNRSQLGAYLSGHEQKPVLKAYCERFKLGGIRIEDALRVFMASLRLPNDYSAAEHLLSVFAAQWLSHNPGTGMTNDPVFATKLVISMMELNDALHSGINDETAAAGNLFSFPNHAITVDDFIAAFRLKDPHGSLPDEHLTRIYVAVRKDRLQQAADNSIASITPEIETVIHPSKLPNRLTYRAASENISITLPQPDPNFSIRLAGQDLRFEPQVLTFARSRTATFRILPAAMGTKTMLFIKMGPSANFYRNIPINKTFTVERAFMNYTFQIAFVNHLSVKRKYLFSMSSADLKFKWIDILRQRIEGCPGDATVPHASKMAGAVALQVLRDSLLAPDDVVPVMTKPLPFAARSGFHSPPGSRAGLKSAGGLQRSNSFSRTYAHGAGKAELDLQERRPSATLQPHSLNSQGSLPLGSQRRDSRDEAKSRFAKTGSDIVNMVQQNSALPLALGYIAAGAGVDAMPRKATIQHTPDIHSSPPKPRQPGRFKNL